MYDGMAFATLIGIDVTHLNLPFQPDGLSEMFLKWLPFNSIVTLDIILVRAPIKKYFCPILLIDFEKKLEFMSYSIDAVGHKW